MKDKALELANLIARMSLFSEVPALNFDPESKPSVAHSKGDHSMGGNRPGGVDQEGRLSTEERTDRQAFLLKSVQHFQRRAANCHTEAALDAVIVDAKRSIQAWEKSPVSSLDGRAPEEGDPMFRRHIEKLIQANEKLPKDRRRSDEEIARPLDVSRQYVNKIRRDMAA